MTGTWKTIRSNDELFRRTRFAMAVHEDRYLVIAGGYASTTGNALKTAGLFDLENASLISLPDLPSERYCCGRSHGAILNGCFYMVDYCNAMYRIELSTRNWERVHNLGIKPRHISTVLPDGKHLYAFGDEGNMRYDPNTNEWTELPQMIRQRNNFASAIVGGKIYIFGGGSYFALSSVEIFDIENQSWSVGPHLPIALHNAAATVMGRWILIIGGLCTYNCLSEKTFIFDTLAQQWYHSNVALIPPRAYHGCAAVEGSKIVSVGGEGHGYSLYFSLEIIHRKDLISVSWDTMKHFILVRELLDQGRAFPMTNYFQKKKGGVNSHSDDVVQKLITDTNLDMFREILSFLV